MVRCMRTVMRLLANTTLSPVGRRWATVIEMESGRMPQTVHAQKSMLCEYASPLVFLNVQRSCIALLAAMRNRGMQSVRPLPPCCRRTFLGMKWSSIPQVLGALLQRPGDHARTPYASQANCRAIWHRAAAKGITLTKPPTSMSWRAGRPPACWQSARGQPADLALH